MPKYKKLNFGCGNDIKSNFINVDITNFTGVDKVFDFNQFPYPFPKDSFDEIYCDNVIEHLDNIPNVLQELHRITKNGGEIRIIVPYYNSYGAYNDVTHTHYFSPYAFEPFYKKGTRGNYFIKEKFSCKRLKLVPTRFGRLFIFEFLQRPLSFILGQIFQTIDITLSPEK